MNISSFDLSHFYNSLWCVNSNRIDSSTLSTTCGFLSPRVSCSVEEVWAIKRTGPGHRLLGSTSLLLADSEAQQAGNRFLSPLLESTWISRTPPHPHTHTHTFFFFLHWSEWQANSDLWPQRRLSERACVRVCPHLRSGESVCLHVSAHVRGMGKKKKKSSIFCVHYHHSLLCSS